MVVMKTMMIMLAVMIAMVVMVLLGVRSGLRRMEGHGCGHLQTLL